MRHLRRLLLVVAIAAVAVFASGPRAEAGYFCYQSGNCQICCDDWTGCCSAACEPCCDYFWC